MDQKIEKVLEFLRDGYHCYEDDATTSEREWLVEEIKASMEGADEYDDNELSSIVIRYAEGEFKS